MEIEEFKKLLKPYRAVMGFDYGSKRLGVAVSDLLLTVASSYGIISRKNIEEDIKEIKKIVETKEIGGIVYGLPLQMDGSEGGMVKEVRDFADKIYPIPFVHCALSWL